MSLGLRLSMYFVALMWLLVAIGIIAIGYCGEPHAINMVVGIAPPALVGTIAVLVEWRVTRGDND